MTELHALLERATAATGPDRELDLDIGWALMTADQKQSLGWHRGHIYNTCEREGGRALLKFFDSAKRPPSQSDYIPFYTNSVDAVIGLVEEKLPNGGFGVSSRWEYITKNFEEKCYGWVRDDDVFEADARTIPLALIAALLKSLIAKASSHGGEG